MSKKQTKLQSFVQVVYGGCIKKGVVCIQFTNDSLKDNVDQFIMYYGTDIKIKEFVLNDRNKTSAFELFEQSIENEDDGDKVILTSLLYNLKTKDADDLIKKVFDVKKGKYIYKLKTEKEDKGEDVEEDEEEDEAPKKVVKQSKKDETDDDEPKKKPAKKSSKKDETDEDEPKKPVAKSSKKDETDDDEPKKPVAKSSKKSTKQDDDEPKKPAKKTAKKTTKKNKNSDDEDEKQNKPVDDDSDDN
jgi:hypothetical protein